MTIFVMHFNNKRHIYSSLTYVSNMKLAKMHLLHLKFKKIVKY